LSVISARLREPGVELEGVKVMLQRQWQRWSGTPQAEYFRPETLFRPSNFDGYYASRAEPVVTVTDPKAAAANSASLSFVRTMFK
jgi:uncharacterized phage protein (TIGR02220 family)